MFICQFSGKVVGPGNRCNKVITKRRKVEYPFRSKVNRKVNHEEERIEWTPDKGGEGYEIVQEINVCDEFLKDALVMYTFERTIFDTTKTGLFNKE